MAGWVEVAVSVNGGSVLLVSFQQEPYHLASILGPGSAPGTPEYPNVGLETLHVVPRANYEIIIILSMKAPKKRPYLLETPMLVSRPFVL